ncbi:hypothetical protein QVD99_007212 [Batrachochytrium dendrobatidis]|nr:hypothetical protein O5D80_007512 [Batrachochytrium dendrobatidis]KAK5666456.1 hypothetical protein QVD99_007212 [Batrachochytrium dendrobatidis]
MDKRISDESIPSADVDIGINLASSLTADNSTQHTPNIPEQLHADMVVSTPTSQVVSTNFDSNVNITPSSPADGLGLAADMPIHGTTANTSNTIDMAEPDRDLPSTETCNDLDEGSKNLSNCQIQYDTVNHDNNEPVIVLDEHKDDGISKLDSNTDILVSNTSSKHNIFSSSTVDISNVHINATTDSVGVTALLAADEQLDVVATALPPPSQHSFTGEEYDSETGLDHHDQDSHAYGDSLAGEAPTYNCTLVKSNLSQWFGKRYLGGYRDKKRGTEYFHAETQTLTPQQLQNKTVKEKFHRDTQTKIGRNRLNQTFQEMSTQMTKIGCYVTTEKSVIKCGKPYVMADEFHAIKNRKAVIIQCFVRQVLARMKATWLRQERDRRVKSMAEKDKRRLILSEKKRLKDIESRLHPKTNKNFEILYNGLENWRLQETSRINGMGYTEPARLAALADLLDQESALLQKIDRLKLAANEENREKSIVQLLEKMASPKRWVCGGELTVLVDTPNTIRARELRDLYHALNLPLLSIDERLQILLHVKYTVKEFDCNLSRDIVELIDREGDLVSRGRDVSSLEGLRKRINSLFLQFIKTPEFNPEAASHQKYAECGQHNNWKRESAVYYCRGCTKYKQSTEFYLSTTMKHLGKCKECTTKENLATSRKDDSAYGEMLKLIRIHETSRRKLSGFPVDLSYNAMALLQESDMRYLVDVIWNRKSAVCGSHSMEELVLTRWDPAQELSPWNCILLTKAESATHDRRPDPHQMYSEDFTNKVRQKHLLAKQHFGGLPAMSKYLKHYYSEDQNGKLVPKNANTAMIAPAVSQVAVQ